jgi:predicted aldo/keto reductase-like oxidoreductase
MQYRPYGNTGIEVSVLAMGGMRYERPDDIDAMAEIPLYLYDQGVNYFDAAPNYCRDKSEEILGTAIGEMQKRRSDGRRGFLVSTKSNKPEGDAVRAECERSLKRLNVEAIDFYHIWCIRTWDEWLERKAGGAVEMFHRLRDEGLVRHVVVSHHLDSADTRRLIEEAEVRGMLLGFNAANFAYREEGIREAHRRGLGVMVMNPLGGGSYWQAPEVFSYLKRRDGDTLVTGGLRFVLSHPQVTAALVGVRSLSDAREAVAAAEGLELYGREELARVKDEARRSMVDLCTGCGYCAECPERIPVSQLMETYNQVLLGSPDAVFGRLKWHWGLDNIEALIEKCIDCGRCEELCTQHLPIRERFGRLREAWLECKRKMEQKKE